MNKLFCFCRVMTEEKATQKTSLRTKAEFLTNEAENQADKFKSKYPFFKVDIMPNQRGHSRLVMFIIMKILHYATKKCCYTFNFH